MDYIAGIGGTGAFMAFGAYIGMPTNRIHGRIIMVNTGNGLTAVALAAGEVGPDNMDIPGLCEVALFAPSAVIKLDAQVRVGQP